jgi:hypothetical protein
MATSGPLEGNVLPQAEVADMLGGLLLTASIALLIWLVVRRRRWLTRAGQIAFDALAASARSYLPAPLPAPATRPQPKDEGPEDLAFRTEAALAARLLDRTLAKDDYHRAMAELAAEDALRRPMSVPPWR